MNEVVVLRKILDTMVIPEKHKSNSKWLTRNLRKDNEMHPQYLTAVRLLRSNKEQNRG